MKKLLAVLVTLAMAFALLAACGSQPDSTPAAPDEPAATETPAQEPADPPQEATEPEDEPADEGPGELNLAIFEGGYGRDFWDAIIPLFEDATGITVNMQIGPDIGDVIRPQIVAGNPPDFLNLNDNDQTGIVAALIQERGLLDLTDVFDGPQFDSDATLRSKHIPGFLASSRFAPYAGDSSIYLAPGNASPMGMTYNMTLFANQGWDVPVTWDDYFALGDLAKDEGIALQTYQGIYPGYMESMLFPSLASHLGDDYAKIENLETGIWTDSRTIAVLEQFEKIYTGGYLMRGTVGLDHTQSQAMHLMDQALFVPNGTWVEGEMADADRTEGFVYGLTPSPVMNASDVRYVAAGIEQFSIPAAAANAENAKLFLRFLYTDEVVRLYSELTGGGAVMATVNAIDVAEPYLTPGTYGMFQAFTQPGAAPLVLGFMSPPEGSTINFGDTWQYCVTEMMSGRMTAQEFGEYMDQAMVDIAEGR